MIDFEGLIRRLSQAGVEFIIIGGVAAVLHGSSRLTQDLDIVYRRTDENLIRLVEALADWHPYLRGAPPGLPFDWSVQTLRRGLNFTLNTAMGPLDIFGEITGGGTYEQLSPHTVAVEIFGENCLTLDVQALIQAKRAAGRPKDFESIAELESVLEERTKNSELEDNC